MIVRQEPGVDPEEVISDQKCTEEDLQGLQIAPKQPPNPTLPQQFEVNLPFRFTPVPRQNGIGYRGTGDRSYENHRGSLVDWGVGFVVSGFRKIDLRDGGD